MRRMIHPALMRSRATERAADLLLAGLLTVLAIAVLHGIFGLPS
jgi:hypothetical protein